MFALIWTIVEVLVITAISVAIGLNLEQLLFVLLGSAMFKANSALSHIAALATHVAENNKPKLPWKDEDDNETNDLF